QPPATYFPARNALGLAGSCSQSELPWLAVDSETIFRNSHCHLHSNDSRQTPGTTSCHRFSSLFELMASLAEPRRQLELMRRKTVQARTPLTKSLWLELAPLRTLS